MMLEVYLKPASWLWRGRGYFAVGGAFWATSLLFALIYPQIATSEQQGWWRTWLNKGLEGLGDAGIVIMIAGIVYVVLTDVWEAIWLERMEMEVRRGFKAVGTILATGVLDITYDAILTWISAGKAETNQCKSVAKSALHAHYGKHTEEENNYVDFIVDNILDKAAGIGGITRENLISRVTIRGMLDQHLLRWEEQRSYTLVCPGGRGNHPIMIDIYFLANPTNVEQLIKGLDQKITIDYVHEIFNFKQWFIAAGSIIPKSGAEMTSPTGGTLVFDGHWVTFRYSTEINLNKRTTHVEVQETSYIAQTERFYTLRVGQPTRGFNFSLVLASGLDDWVVRPPTLAAEEYNPTARSNVEAGGQGASASVSEGWVLPGLALSIEWAAPERAAAPVTTPHPAAGRAIGRGQTPPRSEVDPPRNQSDLRSL